MKYNNTDINIKYADVLKNIKLEFEEAGRKYLENIYAEKHEVDKLELLKNIKKWQEDLIFDLESGNSYGAVIPRFVKVSKLKLPRKLKKKFKKQCCYSYKIDVLLNGSICDSVEGEIAVE